MFIRLELVCVSRDEDVDVQLPLNHSKALHVTPGHHLVAVTQTDAELANGHHFLLRVVHVLQHHTLCKTYSYGFFLKKQLTISQEFIKQNLCEVYFIQNDNFQLTHLLYYLNIS